MQKCGSAFLNSPLAITLLDAFRASTGVGCFLMEKNQATVSGSFPCLFCRALSELGMLTSSCLSFHQQSAIQSERFGGRYIYFCPHGLAHFISPVLLNGGVAAHLIGGPVLIMNTDDFLASIPFATELPPASEQKLSRVLAAFPRRGPAVLNHLSFLLSAIAAQLGNSQHELLFSMDSSMPQRADGDSISDLSPDNADHFPIEKEQTLILAISSGNLTSGKQSLNELCGYIFFHSGGDLQVIRSMALELLFTISSAAHKGGVIRETLLDENHFYFQRLERCQDFEDMIFCLSEALQVYINLVNEATPVVHHDAVDRALRFIKLHFCENLSLECVAAQVSLSPVYFSRLFKESMGISLSVYLNQLRIRRSATLLASTHMSILQICSQCGFADQSYFTKVFKKHTGTSPAKFREHPLERSHALEKGDF